jgi:hypothetical protein
VTGDVQRTVIALAGLLALSVANEATAGICLEVDLRFSGAAPSTLLVQSMSDEASAIWSSYGVTLAWPRAADSIVCPFVHGSFEVIVQQRPVRKGSSGTMVLGSTRINPSAIDRVPILLDREAMEGMLASLPADRLVPLLGRPHVGPADVGRALGRVLAHEIGHVVLGAPRHQRWGLMRPSFVAEELGSRLRRGYSLSSREVERLRQRERLLDRSRDAGVTAAARSER